MIAISRIRELTVRTPSVTHRHAYLSAASGLVRAGNFLYVVADDENHLAVFPLFSEEPGELIRLFPGELPDDVKARKPAKPDLEALIRLPSSAEHTYGALLAIPSGSKPNRRIGSLLALDAVGAIAGEPRSVDFSGVYSGLADTFPKLNIEGAVIDAGRLLLVHRGNKRNSRNACIHYSFDDFIASTIDGAGPAALLPLAIQWFDLGAIEGIPLCFTDAAALPGGGFLFTAVAENTIDNYEDGSCAGAVIGRIDGNGDLLALEPLPPGYKVEGIAVELTDAGLKVLLVTDADDETVPACLLSAEICGWLPAAPGDAAVATEAVL